MTKTDHRALGLAAAGMLAVVGVPAVWLASRPPSTMPPAARTPVVVRAPVAARARVAARAPVTVRAPIAAAAPGEADPAESDDLRPGDPRTEMTPERELEFFDAYFARMDEQRRREPYDADWQAQIVALLKKVAATELGGTTIDNVECGSTLCRIRATHKDIGANIVFSQRFHISLGAALPEASIYSTPDKLASFAYVSREGSRLPEY